MTNNQRSYLRNTQARQRDIGTHKTPETKSLISGKISNERPVFLNARNSRGVIIRQNRRAIYL